MLAYIQHVGPLYLQWICAYWHWTKTNRLLTNSKWLERMNKRVFVPHTSKCTLLNNSQTIFKGFLFIYSDRCFSQFVEKFARYDFNWFQTRWTENRLKIFQIEQNDWKCFVRFYRHIGNGAFVERHSFRICSNGQRDLLRFNLLCSFFGTAFVSFHIFAIEWINQS